MSTDDNFLNNVLPPCTGVFRFRNKDSKKIVYIGVANSFTEGISGKVSLLFKEKGLTCFPSIQNKLEVQWRFSNIAEWRQSDLLRKYMIENGELPLYNEFFSSKIIDKYQKNIISWCLYGLKNILASIFCMPTEKRRNRKKIDTHKFLYMNV